MDFPCTYCGAAPGTRCHGPKGKPIGFHKARFMNWPAPPGGFPLPRFPRA